MTLKELLEKALPENDEAVKNVCDYVKKNSIKFADLGEGQYVGKGKYDEIEKKYNDLKDAENPYEKKYNDLVESSKQDLVDERTKLSGVAKKIAVDAAINNLGLSNELSKQGIKALINYDGIELDDNYNIKGDCLTSQLDSIKEQYKDAFASPQPISTGSSVPGSIKNGGVANKQYTSLDDIRALSLEQVINDLDNINAQLGNLK